MLHLLTSRNLDANVPEEPTDRFDKIEEYLKIVHHKDI